MAAWLLLLLYLGASPAQRVDVIEHNVFLGSEGQVRIRQVIFWRYYGSNLHVVEWRPERKCTPAVYRENLGLWVCDWHEGASRYRVAAPVYRETRTRYDPEVLDRRRLAVRDRDKLHPR